MSSRLAFQSQLASIMEVLANAAVAEICKLVEDEYAVVSLQMSQSQRENKALKRKLHLLELKMARGAAERRLRDGGGIGGRARVQLSGRLREEGASPAICAPAVDVPLWPTRTSGHAPADAVLFQNLQDQSPGGENKPILVKEENVESHMPTVEEPEEEVRLIGDDGVLECSSRGAATRRPRLEIQDCRSLAQTQSTRTADGSRGVENEEEADVVLVKVEEGESANQKSLSIQEGLVESSTDNYKGTLPFDETTQTSSNQLNDLQESGMNFSEVSYGQSSLWSNGAGSYGDSLPGLSSDCTLLSYPPATLGSQTGSSERGWAEEPAAGKGLAAEHSRGFSSSSSFEQQLPVIDLSEDSSPPQVSGQMPARLQRSLNPSHSQGNKGPSKKLCTCSFCGKGFRSPANLESHLRTHTGERPYGCNICGKKFSQFWNLKIHNNIHTGERPYQCPLCLEKFSDPSNLKKHQKRHHPQDGGKQNALFEGTANT